MHHRFAPFSIRRLRGGVLLALSLSIGVVLRAQQQAAVEDEWVVDTEGLFELGRALFEEHAPDDIKAQFRFPSRDEFDEFAVRLQRALQEGSLDDLADYRAEAQAALIAVRAFPDYAPYADWLQERLDYIDAAGWIRAQPPPRPVVKPVPNEPVRAAPSRPREVVPHYDLWVSRMQDRPRPAVASRFVPGLQPIFARVGVPKDLVWLAEIESSFNPNARSPVGARGLFQFMPGTATDMGLSLRPFDERADPRKSAQAAASYLKQLHGKFGSWPLALAAYNAGPGRVDRTLKAHRAATYADIAEALPAETRMYVPKVLATVAVRAGVSPADLARAMTAVK
ncbi:lytic transglycosylase domain-containing protein [Synoicihabitans lomoniglobus]|uniref:Lytic transglycosylase domain-containing protein n=1 Tax=Synoicihabitans lomoniglobus TaxID=2909285 RepID=A0AAF0A0M7_9BACT|nr:lytic transglycosylase domain-containing protein [Opitutaceae bacterium LMO-M01]WED65113.1 lytic transglycosylase domain-containing protein [Opitutaceae bacterium LMO-M01]